MAKTIAAVRETGFRLSDGVLGLEQESLGQRLIREREERFRRNEERIRREERDRERTALENKRAEGAGTVERDSISEGLSTLS